MRKGGKEEHNLPSTFLPRQVKQQMVQGAELQGYIKCQVRNSGRSRGTEWGVQTPYMSVMSESRQEQGAG